MRIYYPQEAAQLSEKWFALNRGIPSASNASKILTPTGALSKQSDGYLNRLLAERAGFGDEPMEPTDWMTRGIDLEPEATAAFEFETGLELTPVSWVTNSAGTAGCSPDGLIYENTTPVAGFEGKAPKASTHYGYLRAGVLPSFYRCQIHFSMAVTGLRKWYFQSYYPGLAPLIVEVKADSYTDKITVAIAEFTARLAEESKRFNLELPHRRNINE